MHVDLADQLTGVGMRLLDTLVAGLGVLSGSVFLDEAVL
jgi:hypothetical protein